MLKKVLIGSVMMITVVCAGGSDAQTESTAISYAPPPPDHYVVFFAPKATQLDAEGEAIVREAIASIGERKPSRIEIVVPATVSGGADVVEGRYAAIQKIISVSGTDAAKHSRVVLTSSGINLPGADDRAEIRLIP